jgi:molybdopterin converting factor small subunit
VEDEMIDAGRRAGDIDLVAFFLQAMQGVEGIEHLGGVADHKQDLGHRFLGYDGGMSRVWVEFYGLARLRAGVAEVNVAAATVREAIEAAERETGLRVIVSPELYLVSVNGDHFTTDLDEPLADGDGLLILGADAGG